MPGGRVGVTAVVDAVVALVKFSSGDADCVFAAELLFAGTTVLSYFLHAAKLSSRQLMAQVIFRRFNLTLQHDTALKLYRRLNQSGFNSTRNSLAVQVNFW
jgi:hypothetical protein